MVEDWRSVYVVGNNQGIHCQVQNIHSTNLAHQTVKFKSLPEDIFGIYFVLVEMELQRNGFRKYRRINQCGDEKAHISRIWVFDLALH